MTRDQEALQEHLARFDEWAKAKVISLAPGGCCHTGADALRSLLAEAFDLGAQSMKIGLDSLASAPAPVEGGPCRHVAGCVECQAKYVPAAPVESAPGACTCGNPKGAHLLSCPAGPATWSAPASPPAEPPRPGSEWECGCGYFSFGPICTKCGRPAGSFPPFPPAEPPAPPDDVACYCGAKRLPFSDRAEITSITGSDGVEHRKDQCIGPAAEPGTCPECAGEGGQEVEEEGTEYDSCGYPHPVPVRGFKRCPTCGGTGRRDTPPLPAEPGTCPECRGAGWLWPHEAGDHTTDQRYDCEACGGTGRRDTEHKEE